VRRAARGSGSWPTYTDPGCTPPNCTYRRIEVGVGYSHADRLTPLEEPGLGRQSGWTHPSWIDNSQTLLLRFTKKAKSSLRRKRSVRLAVAVTFTPKGGGAAQTASARLTLRR
jgi:hypothetical protein